MFTRRFLNVKVYEAYLKNDKKIMNWDAWKIFLKICGHQPKRKEFYELFSALMIGWWRKVVKKKKKKFFDNYFPPLRRSSWENSENRCSTNFSNWDWTRAIAFMITRIYDDRSNEEIFIFNSTGLSFLSPRDGCSVKVELVK